MIEENGEENFIVLSYHNADRWSNNFSQERIQWYFDNTEAEGIYPTAFFDGGASFCESLAMVDDEYPELFEECSAIPSPLRIESYAWIKGGTYCVDAEIILEENIDAEAGDVKVRFAVTEKGLELEGFSEYRAVRMMLDEEDLEISQSGESATIHGEFSINPQWNLDSLSVVTFIQHDSEDLGYPVLQADQTNYLLTVDFAATTPTADHAPLLVEFSDFSTGNLSIISRSWDFNDDGIIDSHEETPQWLYEEPGLYSVSLEIVTDSRTFTYVREDYISAFDGESAVCFDGDDSYGICYSTPELNLTEAITIEAWINPASWGESSGFGSGKIIDKGRFGLFLSEGMVNFTDQSLGFYLYNPSGSPHFCLTPDNTIILNGWQHIAVTYDGNTSQVEMYINGLPQEISPSPQPSGNIADNSGYDLYIGNSANNGFGFDGAIDDLRIWDTVRTHDEIIDNMGQALTGNELDLVSYWNMNEGSGQFMNDISGNENSCPLIDISWVQGTPFVPTTHIKNENVSFFPDKLILHSNYPNPFNPSTTINFELSQESNIDLSIYDVSGRLIKKLVTGEKQAGYHSVVWDGKDEKGKQVNSGLYIYQLKSDMFSTTKQMLLLK